MESDRDIFDEFDDLASELESHHLIEEGELSTLRRLVDHHRTIYERPLGDPAYEQIVDLQMLEDVLRLCRGMVKDASRLAAQGPLDSHSFELLAKASRARSDAARYEQDAIKDIGGTPHLANLIAWIDLQLRMLLRLALLGARAQRPPTD
jgi:hypothetical protein